MKISIRGLGVANLAETAILAMHTTYNMYDRPKSRFVSKKCKMEVGRRYINANLTSRSVLGLVLPYPVKLVPSFL